MVHTFIVAYNLEGKAIEKQEMTYNDSDIVATLARRIKTAFPNATNIQIVRKPDEQLSLSTRKER